MSAPQSLIPQLLTPPTSYPVTLAEVKAQLAIETTDFDARLSGYIAAATAQVERFLGMALLTRSYHGFLDRWPRRHEHGEEWPWGRNHGAGRWSARWIEIPRPPLISIDFVTTYDDTDAATTYPSSNYYVDTASTVGRLVLREGIDPPCPTRTANGLEVGWTCGVGTTLRPFLDDDIRLAIQIAVGALNEQRGDEPAPDVLPGAAQSVLNLSRLIPI